MALEEHAADPIDLPEAAPEAPQPPPSAATELLELSDHSEEPVDGVEVDRWGFQVAMARLREAGEPSEAIAVLTALRSSQPSDELLTRVAWEVRLYSDYTPGMPWDSYA